MYRVIAVDAAPTLVVDLGGVRSNVQLSGIEITDRRGAVAFLSWSLKSSWVMIEAGQVYRSPDAMHVNAELVRKGFARFTDGSAPAPTTPVVYLGELDLGKRTVASTPVRRATNARPSPVRSRAIRPRTVRAPSR